MFGVTTLLKRKLLLIMDFFGGILEKHGYVYGIVLKNCEKCAHMRFAKTVTGAQ